MRLRDVIADYVALQQSMGRNFRRQHLLRAFNRAVGSEIEIQDVARDSVLAFLGRPTTCYWYEKHSSLMRFYQYAISRGHVSSAPLPKTIPKISSQFVPYIYTHDDVRRLLEATNTYRKIHILLEPHTFRTILLLLYGAGLRISEALSLRMGDVDLPEAVLLIRESKFYKSRLVPIGPHLQQAMTQFATTRRGAGHPVMPDAPFFIGRKGKQLKIPYTSAVIPPAPRTRRHPPRRWRSLPASSPRSSAFLLREPCCCGLRSRSERDAAAPKVIYLLGTHQSQFDAEIPDDDAGAPAASLRALRAVCHGGKHQ